MSERFMQIHGDKPKVMRQYHCNTIVQSLNAPLFEYFLTQYMLMSRLMRLWHLSPSVNLIFKHACAAIHWGYTSDFWSDPSTTSILYVCEQRRLWWDSPEPSLFAYAISTIISWVGSLLIWVCEVGLEFAAWDSILRVPRVRVKVRVWVRLTLTLTLNIPQP